MATEVAVDAARGFLELPLSTRLPRVRYLAATIGAQVADIVLLTAVTIGAICATDLFIEPDVDVPQLVLAGGRAAAMAAAIGGVTTLLAVLLLDRGRTGGLAAAILIVMYLLNVVAQLSDDVEWLKYLSAFHYFDLKPLIDDGAYPLGASVLYLAFAVGGWLVALVVFRRRDIAA
jgi:ABC-2 type transport system permease protein